jgi:hypothetical protein
MKLVEPKTIRLSGERKKQLKFCSECGQPLNRQRPRPGSSPEFPDPFPVPHTPCDRNVIR